MIAVATRPERTVTRPAPIKGMNTADMVTALDKGFAQRIDNLICRPDGLQVRPGFRPVDDAGAAVTSLLFYGNNPVARTDGAWRGAMLANPGGQFLFASRSGITPKVYNGSTWSDCSISGVNYWSLVAPVEHGKRIYCIESGTLNIWYLPLESYGGEAKPIYAGAMSKLGGYGVALGSDGQRLYISTSNGELLVYSGLNPATPETWTFAGRFKVPRPVGERCFATSATGGLMYAADTGLYSIPSLLKAAEADQEYMALTAPIEPTYRASGASGVIVSASNDFAAVQTADGLLVKTGNGWSRLLGFNATQWVETADGLYFSRSDGTIYKVDGTEDFTAYDEAPAPIGCLLIDSFSRFGASGGKKFTRIRPHFTLTHPYKAKASMLMNYRKPPSSWEAQYDASSYWTWPEVSYSMMPAEWTKARSERLGLWRGTAGNGEVGALMLGISSLNAGATFIGCDYAFEAGGSF